MPNICQVCAGESDPSVGIMGPDAIAVTTIFDSHGKPLRACIECAVEDGACRECLEDPDGKCSQCRASDDAEDYADAVLDGDYDL